MLGHVCSDGQIALHTHTLKHILTHTRDRLQPWKGESVLTSRKTREKDMKSEAQAQPNSSEEVTSQPIAHIHSDDENVPSPEKHPPRKASVASAIHNLKLLVNPNKKDLSERVSLADESSASSRHRKVSAVTPGLQAHSLGKDLR